MPSRATTTTGLRPCRSPRWLTMAPPIGLARKPAQNVLNESSVPISAEECGKNT